MATMLRLTHTLVLFILFVGNLMAQEHRHYEFVPNKGQEKSTTNYTVNLNVGKICVENTSMLFHFVDVSARHAIHHGDQQAEPKIKGHSYRMAWINANTPLYNTSGKSKHYYNYFKGNDPKKWAGEVYGYEELVLKKLYPGIDVKFETNTDGKLEYTYFIQPGFSPAQIVQQYDGLKEITVSKNGNLLLKTGLGTNQELKPVAWQITHGNKKPVACEYKLVRNQITYIFPNGYDKTKELVIDPVLIFGSYSGSFADNLGMSATYDSDGNLYSGGLVYGGGYPTTTGAWDTIPGLITGYGISDVAISKFTADGSNLIYSTYLGGGDTTEGTETVHSMIINANDELVVFGATSSPDFPVTSGAYDMSFNGGTTIKYYFNEVYFTGGSDIYVTKFNAAGTSLIGSTFVGGTGNDGVNYKVTSGNYSSASSYDSLTTNYGDQFRGEVEFDASGNIYVTSVTRSTDFPVVNAFQPSLGGQQDAVIVKLNPSLTNILYSSFLGGSNNESGQSLELDASSNIFVTGGTTSSDFPATMGALYTTYQGGKADGFVAKISPAFSLLAATYVGTSLYDNSFFADVNNSSGNVYLFGQTKGVSTFPVIGAAYSNPNSGQFILEMNGSLSALVYSSLFGGGSGTVDISPAAFEVDGCGNVYVSGWGGNFLTGTPLSGMPVTANAFQLMPLNGFDIYMASFGAGMSSLRYATYFGGSLSDEHVDGGTSRFDDNGILYQAVCGGCGGNDDFPTTPGSWSETNNSPNCNLAVYKFDMSGSSFAAMTANDTSGCAPYNAQFTSMYPAGFSWMWNFGTVDTLANMDTVNFIFNLPDVYTVSLILYDSTCSTYDTVSVSVTANNCTGINELSGSNMFSVYPSPNNGEFWIEREANTPAKVKITNVAGALVYSGWVYGTKDRIALNGISSGMYFVILENKKVQRLTVNKH